ncbi:MAG: carbonic anhydrase [Rubripirellula sp.]
MTTTTINKHIESLETAFAESAATVDWLVIAHSDALMLRCLASALSGESAAVLALPQPVWEFDGGEFTGAIEWAIQQGNIKNLLLVGHSQAGGTTSRVSIVSSDAKQTPQNDYGKLLASVGKKNEENQIARSEFASQVQEFCQIPGVRQQQADGELTVHGLFYCAESGLFLAYEAETGKYRALMS